MKIRVKLLLGISMLLGMLSLNFLHALNDYGVCSYPMPVSVLAQGTMDTSSTDTSGKVYCQQQITSNHVRTTSCAPSDRNSSCDYFSYNYTCVEGSGYACQEGTIYSGYSCNTNYNSSNCGELTTKKCN